MSQDNPKRIPSERDNVDTPSDNLQTTQGHYKHTDHEGIPHGHHSGHKHRHRHRHGGDEGKLLPQAHLSKSNGYSKPEVVGISAKVIDPSSHQDINRGHYRQKLRLRRRNPHPRNSDFLYRPEVPQNDEPTRSFRGDIDATDDPDEATTTQPTLRPSLSTWPPWYTSPRPTPEVITWRPEVVRPIPQIVTGRPVVKEVTHRPVPEIITHRPEIFTHRPEPGKFTHRPEPEVVTHRPAPVPDQGPRCGGRGVLLDCFYLYYFECYFVFLTVSKFHLEHKTRISLAHVFLSHISFL